MRFQRSEKLAKEMRQEAETFSGDQYLNERKRDIAVRNAKKFGCYVLDIGHKDMSLHEIKMLGLTIEEGVNEAIKKSNEAGRTFAENVNSQ